MLYWMKSQTIDHCPWKFLWHTSAEVHHDCTIKSFTDACKVFWNPWIRGSIHLLSGTGYQPLFLLCFADSLIFMSPAPNAYTHLELKQLFSSSLAILYLPLSFGFLQLSTSLSLHLVPETGLPSIFEKNLNEIAWIVMLLWKCHISREWYS